MTAPCEHPSPSKDLYVSPPQPDGTVRLTCPCCGAWTFTEPEDLSPEECPWCWVECVREQTAAAS